MTCALVVALASLWAQSAPAQTTLPSSPSQRNTPERPSLPKLTVVVNDQNGIAVRSARVQLQPSSSAPPLRCETDFAGRCEFSNLSSGAYELRVEKAGYYAVLQSGVRVGVTANVDVTLSRQEEAHEVVNVEEFTPAIDPAQVSSKEELTGAEIIDIPYPGSHDYRNALNFVPGIARDAFGQPHLAGAEGYQSLTLLDGFNVSQPASGVLIVRTSVDSFRSIEVITSREPAEFGKGSGGVLGLNTRMGDDHFRLRSTDFTPGLQSVRGISISQWVPLVTLSGPIRKGKIWFIDSVDGEYDNNINQQLPSNADTDHIWRVDNLAKLQSNLTARNIVSATFLTNYYHDQYSGLSQLQPQATTPTDAETAYIGSLKDQYYFHGALLETGFGVDQYSLALTPEGSNSYILSTQGAAGNYYLRANTLARRAQGITNLYLPPQQWHGRHDIKVGSDLDRLNYSAEFERQPISFLQSGQPPQGQQAQPCPTDANGLPVVPSKICARYSVFAGGNYSTTYNTEASAYAEDRWLVTNRLLIEPGVRFDWDEIIRTPLLSPRLAGTYIFDDESNTKLSAGIGIIYDNTSLGLIHQPFAGQRVDYFFDSNGNPTATVPIIFIANRSSLEAPRYLNWSAGLEKKLPDAVFLKLEFLEKRGARGFAYNTLNGAIDGNFFLENGRDDRYDALTLSLRHRFRQHYEVFGAYTRSRAHTNQVFDFSVDFPLLSPQLPGPYGWDTPNRFVGWGILPFFNLPILHKVDLVYSGEAHTGLPFLATTDQGEISPGHPPGSFRLPAYYTLNLQFEKRFHAFGRYWALRGGFDNITNHGNAALANGVLDAGHPSPTFIDGYGRAFTGRLRYLGRQ